MQYSTCIFLSWMLICIGRYRAAVMYASYIISNLHSVLLLSFCLKFCHPFKKKSSFNAVTVRLISPLESIRDNQVYLRVDVSKTSDSLVLFSNNAFYIVSLIFFLFKLMHITNHKNVSYRIVKP